MSVGPSAYLSVNTDCVRLFYSKSFSYSQGFLCDRIINIKEKQGGGVGLEWFVLHISSFAWGIRLHVAASVLRSLRGISYMRRRVLPQHTQERALRCVPWLRRVKPLIPLSLSAVTSASSVPAELNIAAAGRGGSRVHMLAAGAAVLHAPLCIATYTFIKRCAHPAATRTALTVIHLFIYFPLCSHVPVQLQVYLKQGTVSELVSGAIEAGSNVFDLISMAAILISHSHNRESVGGSINPHDFFKHHVTVEKGRGVDDQGDDE